MKIIVTGASGFIGSHLVKALAEAGHSGIAVSRRRVEGLPPGWKWMERNQMLKGAPDATVNLVIHMEVKQHVQNPSAADLKEFETVNVLGTREWLQFSGRHGINNFLYFSSIKAVGDSAQCQTEQDQSVPNTPYGKSKLGGENETREWAAQTKGRTVVIVRPAVVYGPGNQANILSLIKAVEKNRFFFVGKNNNVKSLVSLNNLTAAITFLVGKMSVPAESAIPVHATQKERGSVEVYYLVDKESYSVAAIADMIQKGLGKQGRIRSLPLPVAQAGALAGDVFTRVTGKDFPLTSNRLRALLESTHFSSKKLEQAGFVHPETTEEGLARMIQWHRSEVAR
ncbi:MAG: NAD-dependent epimerase/dehydratase family protein [Verrucomicrobiales bacterium]